MRSLIRATFGLNRAGAKYQPRQWGAAALDEVDVPGPSLVLASQHYFGATLDYMMSEQEFRSIRLDLVHRVRLVSNGRNVVANRAQRHRNEAVYTVAIRFCVARAENGERTFTGVRLAAMLASDFDRFMTDAGAVAIG